MTRKQRANFFNISVGISSTSEIPDQWHFETDPDLILGSVRWITDPNLSSGFCFFRLWPSTCQHKKVNVFSLITYCTVGKFTIVFKDHKSWRSHTTAEIKVPQFFACWLTDPGPYKLLRIRILEVQNIRIRNTIFDWCLQSLTCPMSQNEFYSNSTAASKWKIGTYLNCKTFGTLRTR